MKAERLSRALLKELKPGQLITVDCANHYDADAQMATAYHAGKLFGRKFSCHTEGLTLTVTRTL